jgi:ABC-type multidrug transport system fused ATPase/permease subunit
VLITHRLPAVQLADQVLVLRAGEIAAVGTPAEVLPKREPRAEGPTAQPV